MNIGYLPQVTKDLEMVKSDIMYCHMTKYLEMVKNDIMYCHMTKLSSER